MREDSKETTRGLAENILANSNAEGLEFISKPQLMHDEKRGGFFYLKDPDGIHMEFLVFNQ